MILAEYAATLGGDTPFSGTRLTMTVDDLYHLQLLARQDGRVLLRTRLRALPEAGPARNEILRQCGELACGRMITAPVSCAIDKNERNLWLQQLCEAGTTQMLDEHVGSFVNELAFWRSAVRSD